MKKLKLFCAGFVLLMMTAGLPLQAQETTQQQATDQHENVRLTKKEKTLKTHWAGRRVGILGDSMTSKKTLGPEMLLWWEYLSELMGFKECYNYAHGGHQWHQIFRQAQSLWQEHAENIDAIIIFAGTNDYNAGVPIGEFFEYEKQVVEVREGKMAERLHRKPIMCDSTFCGRLNQALSYLRTQYPDKSIVMMTPIHRGYAKFKNGNVQPDEYYCNAQGRFLEEYVSVMKQAAAYWSVPVVDLYANSGIVPNLDSNIPFIKIAATDRLHPSTEGQYRIAKVLQYQLPTIY